MRAGGIVTMRPSESTVYGLQLYRAVRVSVFPATPENENDPAYSSHVSCERPPGGPKLNLTPVALFCEPQDALG